MVRSLLIIAVLTSCFASNAAGQASAPQDVPSKEAALDQIAFIHGGTGPFAVAGYRIGERALKETNLPRGTFTLEVIHKSPREVQFSCIADGVQAATGVSVGKLNLRLEEVSADAVETVVRDRKTGQTFVFRLKPEFVKRFWKLPHDKLSSAGKEVLSLSDDEIFSVSRERQN